LPCCGNSCLQIWLVCFSFKVFKLSPTLVPLFSRRKLDF
jgi:hypothetical protein